MTLNLIDDLGRHARAVLAFKAEPRFAGSLADAREP